MALTVCIFWLSSSGDPHQDESLCTVLSPTCLGISDWRCDCVFRTQPLWPLCRPQPLFTHPTCYALCLSLSVFLFWLYKCCMMLTWPSECLLTNIRISGWFVPFLSCLSLCERCELIFHWVYWHSIFIGCNSPLKVIVRNDSSAVMGVCLSLKVIWCSEAGEFSVGQDFVLKEHSNNLTCLKVILVISSFNSELELIFYIKMLSHS